MSEQKMEKVKESFGGFEYTHQKGLEERVVAEFKEDFLDVIVEEENKMEEKGIKEKQEIKEETQEEKKERYIDILFGIGFLKGKEKGDGKERYYYKIDDNSAVGRTFDSRTPLGKFWAKVDGEWLKGKECKEVAIIKRFYAIRNGEEEMPEKKVEEVKENEEERKEIVVREETPKEEEVVTDTEVTPAAVVQDAQRKADMLSSVVEKQHLYQNFFEKKYLTLEAWQALGKMCGLKGVIEHSQPVDIFGVKGFEARAVITDGKGDTVAVAESMCLQDEKLWEKKPLYQLRSMSQTRALSKGYRSCLSYIVALAGYAVSPAEEMTE